MTTMACRAVAQAGRVAATASLDGECPERLLLVAGWHTTAADVLLEAIATGPVPDAAPAPGPVPGAAPLPTPPAEHG